MTTIEASPRTRSSNNGASRLLANASGLDAFGPGRRMAALVQASSLAFPWLAALLVVPSILWVTRDQSVWPFDQAWYGEVSLMLYAALAHPLAPRLDLHAQSSWLSLMMAAFGSKAPAIAWLGQFFVPLGVAFGHIELGLLTLVLLTQASTLIVVFVAYRRVSHGRIGVAFVGCMCVAMAPLFVAMSHQYFVEPLQTLAVAWFIAIMIFARVWSKPVVIVHLIAASAFGMLVKASSPLYCILPGLAAVLALFQSRPPSAPSTPRARMATRLALLAASLGTLVLTTGTIFWYAENWSTLTTFVQETSSGPIAALYGQRAEFAAKVGYWLAAAQQSFFAPVTALFVAVIAGTAMVMNLRQRSRASAGWSWPGSGTNTMFAAVASAQIVLVLGVFALQINDEERYLLALMPYVGLLIVLALTAIDKTLVNVALVGLLALQGTLVYAVAYGSTPRDSSLSYWLVPLQSDGHLAEALAASVARTCAPGDAGRYAVVGVDLSWFNANSLSFYAEKRTLAGADRCYYTSLGYAESDPERAWNRMAALKAHYLITVDPRIFILPGDGFNRVSVAVFDRAVESPAFTRVDFPEDPRILIFLRADGAEPVAAN